MTRSLLALLLAAAAPAALAQGAGEGLLDGFETLAPWQASASDGVRSAIRAVPGTTGQAMRLDYDFGQVSGYAFAHRALPVAFPDNYLLSFRIRGTGGVNDLQLKFADPSGANVWWHERRNFRPSAEWQTIRIRPRDMAFAWGPTDDKTLRRTASVELVLVRGRDGGAGHLEIDDLKLEPLPAPASLPPPKASDPAAIDGRRDTVWQARAGRPLTIDFGGPKELGGLVLHWQEGASAYAIEASDDARRWRMLRTVTDGNGGDDPIALPETLTRYLRVVLPEGAHPAALAELEVQPLGFAATPNAFVEALAKKAPRGSFPRGFTEQSYWTLVGTDGGSASGLIGEDGAIEVAKGGFSVEPFVVADGRRFTWADVAIDHSLAEGYLPIPTVGWTAPGWRLETSVFADETAPRLMARWRLTNTGSARRTLRLVLAVRPFQVNGPLQFLSQQGGVSRIAAVRWQDGALAVTTPPAIPGDPVITRRLLPLRTPDAVGTRSFDGGGLEMPAQPGTARVLDDPTGLGSAALAYDLTLAPGESAELPMAIPFGDGMPIDAEGFAKARAATVVEWKAKLDRVAITVPAGKQPVADTVKSALAQVLMSRDGPALKPGTRSYDRSWIRDGAMISDTLLRLGVVDPARAFADWYSTNLFDNGKVPCCVDFRGPDPVPENDAQGQYIHLLVQLYRYTGDRAALEREWPLLEKAWRYMEAQRQSERTAANRTPERRMLYGLMPPSISHEGYSAKPQYSLWDDFWALTGYKDLAEAARLLGKPEAAEIARQRDEFARDIRAAIDAAAAYWKIDYIPGATSLGDFDATSTTMAFDPAGEADQLDQRLLRNTFERQWRRVMDRDQPGADWADYTPYELRNVSAMVRLGWRERANQLLDFYMDDRRPHAWNGWAEVVGRDLRERRFLGDVPHAWVASDFIRSALDLFAYARDGDDAIVLGGGMDESWLAGAGSAVRGLRTPSGTIDLAMRADADRLEVTVGGSARPAGGYVLPWPLAGGPGAATIDGKPARFAVDGLHIPAIGKPVRVVVRRGR
ncbi:discoidin domain-containing protein [Sphingomonas sp. ac-8]|uniref:discoidin domain-containing protein n=1 Tax=Sphingomonas sp. ac-8 TaxID=3242977 RepID=UPI003A80DEE3